MGAHLDHLAETKRSEIPVTIRNAGVAGAGGAGFPTYAKWEWLDDVDYLLVNHQESEPNYFIDKWLGREHAEEFARLFDVLLESVFDVVVVGAKDKDREAWMAELESATDGAVYGPDDLPIDPDEESGVVFAYTDDRYEYGMESVLLRMVADTVIGNELPMDHGWIVQNTETLYNVYRALEAGAPVTRKYLHTGGEGCRHRFLRVPIGTPATAMLEAAGFRSGELRDNQLLVDGGPGWCFAIHDRPEKFGVRKRTNCLMVLDRDVAEKNTLGEDRINVLGELAWEDPVETEPTATLSPKYVRIPLVTNPAFEGIVFPSEPIVESGDAVSEGEMIATPGSAGISNPQHASIDGEVTEVTDTHVEIRSETPRREMTESEQRVYWTWCIECGTYVVQPETEGRSDPTHYVCEECR